MSSNLTFSSANTTKKPKSNFFPILIISIIFSVLLATVSFLVIKKLTSIYTATNPKGEKFLKSGQYKKAFVNYKLMKGSKNASKSQQFGAMLGKAKSLIAIAWDNYNATAWREYGKDSKDYMPSRELSLAIKELEELNSKFNSAEAHYLLGIIYQEKGWSHRAIEAYKTSIKINPKFWEAYNNLGTIYIDISEYKMAEKAFKILLRKNKHYDKTYINLASLYAFYLGNTKKADMFLNSWDSINPKHIMTYEYKQTKIKIEEEKFGWNSKSSIMH